MVGEPERAPLLGDSLRNNSLRAALQQNPWRVATLLSSALDAGEQFLARAGFDRAPWLAVGFAFGIAAWFDLPNQWQWASFIAAFLAITLATVAWTREDGRLPYMRQAIAGMALMAAAGCAVVWSKSALVGMPAIAAPWVGTFAAEVIEREEQPAEQRVRLTLALVEPDGTRAIKIRVNVPLERDALGAQEGAVVRVRARLVPPAPPMLPGSYNFARAAWFDGLAATGSALESVEVLAPGKDSDTRLARLQRRISAHVQAQIGGSAGGIAAAFASGDRGGIAQDDEDAMRNSGLTHLLSVSGLHVSAVLAIAYFLAMRLFGLWPWLVLRVRLPLLAAGSGALAAIAYTLLTGAQVPTVRSCIGALLILVALVIGREPLSFRLVGVAAFVVMLIWPEAVVGPGFQMSFASVIAIVALHSSAPIRAFMAPREEAWWQRGLRNVVMLLITGIVIEAALMPIAVYHFHRSGIYGALANVVAIPMTEFLTMPLIGLGFVLDAVGLGAPAWWLAGKSLQALLWMAHFFGGLPGAVTRFPAMEERAFLLFVIGSLWLALWHGRVRLLGLVPVTFGLVWLLTLRPPDLLVAGDGVHVGITGLSKGELVVLRQMRSDFAKDSLNEMAGMNGDVLALADMPGARCSTAFCAFDLQRGGRIWRLLMARSRQPVAVRDLAAACENSDIVIADRWLPPSCKPKYYKLDRQFLGRTGGLALDLERGTITSVAESEGDHGWWRVIKRSALSPQTLASNPSFASEAAPSTHQ